MFGFLERQGIDRHHNALIIFSIYCFLTMQWLSGLPVHWVPTVQYDSRSSPAGSSVQLEASPAVLSLGPKALPFAQH